MHVCIVGAGITGLATAYVLQQAGYRVTVVDRGPLPQAPAAAMVRS